MSPDFAAPSGLDEFGGASPLPPHVQTELDALTDELQRAKAEHDRAFADQIDPMTRVLKDATGEHALALSEVIGDVDSTLRAAVGPHLNAIVKSADTAFRDLALAQEGLRYEGVPIPTDAETIRAHLEDPTGEMVLTNLLAPTDALMPTVTSPDAPPLVEVPPVFTLPPAQVTTIGYDAVPGGVIPPGNISPMPPPSPPVPPPVPPPPPAPATAESAKCPDKPCPPPATWERSQVCKDARPFYESNAEEAVAEGRAFVDPYNLRYYYTEGVPPECIPAPPQNLDPEWIRRLRGDGCCPETAPLPEEEVVSRDAPRPSTVVAPTTSNFGLLWADPEICKRLDEQMPTGNPTPVRPPMSVETASTATSITGRIMEWGVSIVRDVVGEINRAELSASFLGEATAYVAGAALIEPVWAALDPKSVPNREASSRLAVKIGLAKMVERKTGVPLDYLTTTEHYLLQYSAPQFIPEQPGLDLAYLRDEITGDQWACLTRANGNVQDCAEWVLNAKQTRPDAAQVVELYQRGKIKTREDLHDRLRELGVLDKLYEDNLIALAQWIPTPPDVIRFMVRDVFDESAVQVGQYDKDFEAKFYGPGGKANPGKAAEYMRAFGVGEEEARYFWRAHWEMPSPTQLYEMLHRLRLDRPAWREWFRTRNAQPDPIAWERQNPAPIVMLPQDVRKALEIDDKAPGFIDALMAISYHPMTRTDAIQAFMANLMDAEELHHRFRDVGMDEPTAKRAVEIQTALKARRNANISGLWTIRKSVRAFKRGGINSVQLDQLLRPLVPDNAQRATMIAQAETELGAEAQEATVAGVRKNYIRGAQTQQQTIAALQRIGLGAQQANQLAVLWDATFIAPRKEATARMIVEWVTQLILTPADALVRLENLGFGKEDRELIVTGAISKTVDKLRVKYNQAKAEFKQEIKDARAAARQETQALTARQKEIQQQMEKWQKEQERIRKELEARTNP